MKALHLYTSYDGFLLQRSGNRLLFWTIFFDILNKPKAESDFSKGIQSSLVLLEKDLQSLHKEEIDCKTFVEFPIPLTLLFHSVTVLLVPVTNWRMDQQAY